MARVEIHFEDDHGNVTAVVERSVVPIMGTDTAAAALANEAFRRFLRACGLAVDTPESSSTKPDQQTKESSDGADAEEQRGTAGERGEGRPHGRK
jgi:hypothetical protein